MLKPIKSFMMTLEGTSINDWEKKIIEEQNPIGVSLFVRNLAKYEQIEALTKSIYEAFGRDDVLIAVDQEGGRVRRLLDPEFQPYVSQYTLGALPIEATRMHAQLIADDLNSIGINMNYAPSLDVFYDYTDKVLHNRCFSRDEVEVAKYGKVLVDEYINLGICPCIKHMPGHGRTSTDPHLGLPILNYSLKELEKDIYPFKELRYSPSGMTAHIIIPEIDDKNPITQSKKGISQLIRGEIGFDGLLFSDALDMKALQGSFAEKTKISLEAGCDVVCCYTTNKEDLVEIYENSSILSDNSLIRFEKVQNIIKNKRTTKGIRNIARKYALLVGEVDTYSTKYDSTEILKLMGVK